MKGPIPQRLGEKAGSTARSAAQKTTASKNPGSPKNSLGDLAKLEERELRLSLAKRHSLFLLGVSAFLAFAFFSQTVFALSFAPAEQAPLEAGASQVEETIQPEPVDPPPYWITNRKSRLNSNQDKEDRPYWLPEPSPASQPPKNPLPGNSPPGSPFTGKPKPASPLAGTPTTETAALFAPPAPTPAPTPAPAATRPRPAPIKPKDADKTLAGYTVKEFSFYKFTDESGTIHLTDAPADPRYRLFTVQITISRGLAPFKRLNIDSLTPLILKAAKTHGVNPALIASVIKAESAFDPKAVSWAGARGLMQLMPKTAALVGCKDSFDPEQNVLGGTKYLRMMLDRFNGDVTLALAAYNSGPERVAKSMAVPDISETRNYVKTVARYLDVFEAFFATEEILSNPVSGPVEANSQANNQANSQPAQNRR
jgi:soluble lytic murein transglycosylase